MPWTPTVSRSVHSVKHYNKRSRDSLMISRGGLKRRRFSVPASYRHTDGSPKSALGQKPTWSGVNDCVGFVPKAVISSE
jgi:hypothetical protein